MIADKYSPSQYSLFFMLKRTKFFVFLRSGNNDFDLLSKLAIICLPSFGPLIFGITEAPRNKSHRLTKFIALHASLIIFYFEYESDSRSHNADIFILTNGEVTNKSLQSLLR